MMERLSIASFDRGTTTFGPETPLLGVTAWSGIRYATNSVGVTRYERIGLNFAVDSLMTSEAGKETLRCLQMPKAGDVEKRLTVQYTNGKVEEVKVFAVKRVRLGEHIELVCNGPDNRGS